MKLVEINGIKLEIDERTARTIDSYKVGDPVKVLIKSYGDSYTVYNGVIVGFADFAELPCIEVMYASGASYDSDTLKFVTLNAKSADVQIAPLSEAEMVLDKENIMEKFDRAIREAHNKVDDLERKRAYFDKKFAPAFETQVAS